MGQSYSAVSDSESAPPNHKRHATFLNKRFSLVGGVVILLIIILFSSQRLSSDGYSSNSHANDASSSVPTIPTIATTKAAVIVENRPLHNLIPVILHFSSVLGSEWSIHVFTGPENFGMFTNSVPFKRNIDAGLFQLRSLPADTSLNTHAAVSGFFTKPWFWEQMAPVKNLLLFQADSIICSNSEQKVDEYLEWDFVGAPVDEARGLGMGFNGGLSLRNRQKFLEITQSYDWQVERHGDHSKGNIDYEDQWFSQKLRELPAGADGLPSANLPSVEVAQKFSVETMWFDKPLGYHQPNVWQKERMDDIYRWCPEYRMCTTETFTDHNTENFGG
jgi:hypothetical protein